MFLAAYSSSDLILFLLELANGLSEMANQFIDKVTQPIMPLILDVTWVDIILGGGFWVFLGYIVFVLLFEVA